MVIWRLVRVLGLATLTGFSAVPSGAAEIVLADASATWHIDIRHHHAGSGELYMNETMGAGVAIFDYDGDGDSDVFFVDSNVLPGYTGPTPRSRLLRNDGPTRFVDVTDASGIEVTSYGMGAYPADIDNDGDFDLYISAFGADQMFRNNGNGSFTDISAQSGVDDPRWSTAAAFLDGDGDGDLDLYVARYVDFTLDNNKPCGLLDKGLRSYCHPDVYEGEVDSYYRNRGDGTFENASATAGITAVSEIEPGKGLGAVASDLDGDGALDVYVANDMTVNFQLQGKGDGTFEDVALFTGTAVSDLGENEAGMGIGIGDVDANGHFDLFVTHLDLQTNALYANQGSGIFADRRFVSKLGEPSLYKVGFGTAFADLDHDTDLDVVVANGHIIHNIEQWGNGSTYKQANQIFENLGDGSFAEAEAGLEAVRSSRGLALGDLDLDGDLDLLITNNDDRAEIYENQTRTGGWLQLAFVHPGHGLGYRVEVTSADAEQIREVVSGSSYLSQHEPIVHVGLDKANKVDRVVVRTPTGHRFALVNPPIDRRLVMSTARP
ncbi:MAG: CRTAC1 family protein [Acidobacteriota bacterium]